MADECLQRCPECGCVAPLDSFDVLLADDGKLFCPNCNREVDTEDIEDQAMADEPTTMTFLEALGVARPGDTIVVVENNVPIIVPVSPIERWRWANGDVVEVRQTMLDREARIIPRKPTREETEQALCAAAVDWRKRRAVADHNCHDARLANAIDKYREACNLEIGDDGEG